MHSKDNILSKCKIDKISNISKDKLSVFYKKLYPDRYKSLTENWSWWYRVESKFAEPIILSLDSRVIGQAAFLKNNLIISDKKIPAIWFQDYAVLPEFMGTGLGKLLTKEWMKICPNQMAMCSPYSLRVLKKFGWIDNFETQRMVRPINYLKFVPILNKLNLNFFHSTLRFFLKRRFKSDFKIKPYELIKNFKVVSDSFGLKKMHNNSNNFPQIDRDLNWLNWRLMECPYKKDIYFFEHNNSFSIVHIYSVKKLKRLNILFTYSVEKNEEVELYKLIASWAIQNQVDYLWAIHRSEKFRNVFPKIYDRPLRFASWSSDKNTFDVLQKGFLDLQGIDSDIESAFFIE